MELYPHRCLPLKVLQNAPSPSLLLINWFRCGVVYSFIKRPIDKSIPNRRVLS